MEFVCTLPILDVALLMRFAKKKTKRLISCIYHKKKKYISKIYTCYENYNIFFENFAKILCLSYKTIFDVLQTRLNVTKRHASDAKRSNETLET